MNKILIPPIHKIGYLLVEQDFGIGLWMEKEGLNSLLMMVKKMETNNHF